MPSSTLIVYAHPSPHKSRVNRHLFQAATSLDFVTGRDLYECYPHFYVDIAVEQQLLRQYEVIVFQFPLYWYSAPALLKEWVDTVLTRGFSYGEGERALKNKSFMLAVTTGGGVEAYNEEGLHGAALTSYLAPLEQTARFCDMKIEKPFIVQGAGDLTRKEVNAIEKQYQKHLSEIGG